MFHEDKCDLSNNVQCAAVVHKSNNNKQEVKEFSLFIQYRTVPVPVYVVVRTYLRYGYTVRTVRRGCEGTNERRGGCHRTPGLPGCCALFPAEERNREPNNQHTKIQVLRSATHVHTFVCSRPRAPSTYVKSQRSTVP